MCLYNIVTHHTTNYFEIFMLCAKLWTYLLGGSRFPPFWIKRKSNALGNKTKSGLEKTKENYKSSSISVFGETIQDELQAK